MSRVASIAEALSAGATSARSTAGPATPVTAEELRAALALRGCVMLPGSWDKRFARDMAGRVTSDGGTLTPRQRLWLWKLVQKYRGQIRPRHPDLPDLALERISGLQGDADAAKRPMAWQRPDDTLAGLLGAFLGGCDDALLLMSDRCAELGEDAWQMRMLGYHATLKSIEGTDARGRRGKLVEAVRADFAALAEPLMVIETWRRYRLGDRGRFLRAMDAAGLAYRVDGEQLRCVVLGPATAAQRSKLRVAWGWLQSEA